MIIGLMLTPDASRPLHIPLYHTHFSKTRMFTPPPSPQPPHVGPAPSSSSDSLSTASAGSVAGPSRSRSPSPLSRPIRTPAYDFDAVPLLSPPPPGKREELKRKIGRRTKWASILVVPLVLILVAATTRYLAHPAVLDVLGTRSPTPESVWDWNMHKRHPQGLAEDSNPPSSSLPSSLEFPTAASSSTSSASTVSASAASASSGAIPTVPSTDPVIPTPFPQPFDSLGQNFSSLACQNFFINMTQTEAFRSCRPFSLLLQSSNDFIQVS
jgi:hypothetical protein